ncbi:MAG: hypothetical protein RhofKO_31790 [Rhodothermales bacterium]
MDDTQIGRLPPALEALEAATLAAGFTMPSERQTGALLRTLAASKPGGRILELGTGTGLATAWLLNGLDAHGHLDSVDSDAHVLAIAQQYLGADARLTLHQQDGAIFLTQAAAPYDLIFADAWPGKYSHLDEALALLNPAGLYVIDDMLPQPNWPAGHADHVARLLHDLDQRSDLAVTRLAWSTGLVMATRVAR